MKLDYWHGSFKGRKWFLRAPHRDLHTLYVSGDRYTLQAALTSLGAARAPWAWPQHSIGVR